jgi:hypothetical protein
MMGSWTRAWARTEQQEPDEWLRWLESLFKTLTQHLSEQEERVELVGSEPLVLKATRPVIGEALHFLSTRPQLNPGSLS